ncbi:MULTISPECIES: hypothetical protein [Rhodomicrobium]|uniref:hypothetical protein n=1 Tax=Rhodomicrobium TaxID=1068 RepID=UPI000B4A9115|nr:MULTISPECIES: hypothetical protein [Rhodomicrobium]
MDAAGLLEAMVETGNQIDSEWQMYIVVHLGLFWFFFLVHRPLLLIERGVALFAYGAFAFINGNGLISTYNLIEAMRLDLITRLKADMSSAPQTATALANVYYGDRTETILITHVGAFFVVAIFLLFRNVMIRRYQKVFPGAVSTGGLLD